MRIAIASDHGGFELKEKILSLLIGLGHEVQDMGCYSLDSVDYPLQACKVAKSVASGQYDRGILICGTGIGMSIAANRIPSIRAALCHDIFTARMSREHNDSNVLCMGGRVTGPGLAEEMVKIWLKTPFKGGRHERRICMIDSESF
ncbi:MAG: ribose 5-phosphate isomerase B [Nitrospiraceae bacterium]|nr:ribose 5-phosphate isomerase B [Nitrospiraceae bacterium]